MPLHVALVAHELRKQRHGNRCHESTGAATRRTGGSNMNHIRRLSHLPILFAFVTATSGISSAENLNLPYRPAVGSRWIGTIETRETKTRGQSADSTIVREKNEH